MIHFIWRLQNNNSRYFFSECNRNQKSLFSHQSDVVTVENPLQYIAQAQALNEGTVDQIINDENNCAAMNHTMFEKTTKWAFVIDCTSSVKMWLYRVVAL